MTQFEVSARPLDNSFSRPLDASLCRPKLDTTLIFDGREEHEAAAPAPQSCPLLALISVNAGSAPSAEVPFSQLLALSLVKEGDPPVLTVGRHKDCNVQLADPRVSLHHFEVSARRLKCGETDGAINGGHGTHEFAYECVLHDSSSNGTAINGRVVGKGNTERLRSGDEICVLPANRVGREKMIAFVFRNTAELLTPQPALQPVQELVPTPSSERANAQALELEDLVVCPICMQAIYKCVALMPCFHNFCMACYSDWMHRKDECPVCRRPVAALMKNHPMEAVIEAFLEANPDRRRSPEELREMDARDALKLGAGGKIVRDTCWHGTGNAPPAPQAPPLPPAVQPPRPAAGGHEAVRPAAVRGRAHDHARAAALAAEAARRQPSSAGHSRQSARPGSQVCSLQ